MLPDMVTGDTCRSCHHEFRSRLLRDGEVRINGYCEQNAVRSPETDIDMGNGCRKKENDFLGFTRKILVESTKMCYDTNVGKMNTQIWFIGRTLASQAGKAGSIPVICFLQGILRN